MDISLIEKIQIGKEDRNVIDVEINDLRKGLFKRITAYFINKFSLLVVLVDYSGNLKFHLINPKSDKIKIDGGVYWINDDFIKKTNTNYNLICFNEGNPTPKDLSHESNKTISAQQLKDFMDSELVGMALKFKGRNKGLGMMFWLIIAGAILGIFLFMLQMLGIVDVLGFFIVR